MRLTLEQLQAVVAAYVDSTKIGGTWVASTNNIAGLLDKIGKTFTIDGLFPDKLPELDGEDLPLGKTVEEWYQDLILPSDYDSTGADALKPSDPTYRPVAYSYSLGRKKIKTTYRYDNLERACNTQADFTELVNTITKRLYDSLAQFKYNVKKDILGDIAKKASDAMSTNTAYATGKPVGTFVKDGSSEKRGVCMVNTTQSTFANAVTNGEVVELDLIRKIAKPTDTASGTAFVQAVKEDVETASFVNEGHSFNGNTIGAEDGLILFVLKGVKPVLEAQVNAGAFQMGELAVPAEMKVVDDFGDKAPAGVFAILMDKRGARLHQDYQALRTNENGDGDFINYVLHYEGTAFESRNTFVKVYEAA